MAIADSRKQGLAGYPQSFWETDVTDKSLDTVASLLNSANAAVQLSDTVRMYLLRRQQGITAFKAAGMNELDALYASICFFAGQHVIAVHGSANSPPVQGASRERFLQQCATVFDILQVHHLQSIPTTVEPPTNQPGKATK